MVAIVYASSLHVYSSKSSPARLRFALLMYGVLKLFPLIPVIAKKHNVSTKTVSRYWKIGSNESCPVEDWAALESKKKGRVGRKRIDPKR